MADTATAERFRRFFRDWRRLQLTAEELKEEEESFLSTTIFISDQVDGTNLADLQQRLIADSHLYTHAGKQGGNLPHKRIYGSILYAKLALQDYYEQCNISDDFANGERDTLNILLTTFNSFYENPLDKPAIKFQSLLDNTNIWLNQWTLNSANSTLSKTTLLALYTMLAFCLIKLNDLEWYQKAALVLGGIDRIKAITQVQNLLNKTAAKVMTIPVEPADEPPLVEPPPTLEEVEQTIEAYFDAQCLKIVEQEGTLLPVKMNTVQTLLSSRNTYLSDLIAEKEIGNAINNQIDHALKVLDALDSNEQKSFGKQYILDLINSESIKPSFNDLISHSPENEQLEWEERMEQLTSPNLARAGLSALSWATFIPTGFYHALAPNSVKKIIDNFTPSTFDSESKLKLKNLATARVLKLQEELTVSNDKKQQIATRLTSENPALKPLLLQETTFKLEQLLATNHAITQVITEYAVLSAQIIENQQYLRSAQGLDENIKQFIADHDGFFVQLSLLLSKISVLFKTNTATKVEEIKTIRGNLETLKTGYAEAIIQVKNRIISLANPSNPIKEAVEAKLTPTEDINLPPPDAEAQPGAKNILTAYNLVKRLFGELSPPTTPAEEVSPQPPL